MYEIKILSEEIDEIKRSLNATYFELEEIKKLVKELKNMIAEGGYNEHTENIT